MKRLFVGAIACLALTACGQGTTPSTQQIQKGVKFFEVTRPDKTKMDCLSFSQWVTDSDQKQHLAFAVDCDWSGHQHAG